MTETSLIVANKRLDDAHAEINVLRRLTQYTIAMIAASGGRVEIPDDKIREWSKRPWRHEFDGTTHIFTTKG